MKWKDNMFEVSSLICSAKLFFVRECTTQSKLKMHLFGLNGEQWNV